MRSRSVAAIACAVGTALAVTACAPASGGNPTQSLTPTGSARPPASMCDASSLTSSGEQPWDVRRGPGELEPSGTVFITLVLSVKVAVPCTGGDWQVSMGPAGGQVARLGHAGEAGPFGPYQAGELLTFRLSWPEVPGPETKVSTRVQINGFEIAADARNWSPPATTWAGPTLGEPTFTFPPTP